MLSIRPIRIPQKTQFLQSLREKTYISTLLDAIPVEQIIEVVCFVQAEKLAKLTDDRRTRKSF
jgi:hypothetical protein